MTPDELAILIDYRLKRADETIQEAKLMQREGHWNACANRLYYAAFYAVSSLLVRDGFASGKHTGIKSHFNLHYIKAGKLPKDSGRLYNRLFDLRQEGDYIDFVNLSEETVGPLLPDTERLITDIKALIRSE